MTLTPEQLAAAKAKLLQAAPKTEPSSALSEQAAAAKAKLLQQAAPGPAMSQAPAQEPQPQEQEEQDGFLKSLVKEPLKALVIKPAVRLAEAAAGLGLFGKDVKRGAELNSAKGTEVPMGPLGPIKVEPVKTGMAGVKQTIGEGLEAGSYLVGGGAAKKTAETAVKKTVGRAIGRGAVEGFKGGALYGAGEGFQKDKDAAGIAAETAVGAGTGTLFGGAFGAAAHGVGKIANRVGSSVVDRAEATMRDVAGMSKKQAQAEARGILKGRKTGQEQPNDVRTLAEEGIFWKDKNEGGALKHDTVDAQEQLGKRIDETEEIYQHALQEANPNARHDLQALKREAIDGARSNSAQTTKELRQKIADAVDAEIELNGRFVNNETFNKIKRGMYERGRYETMAEAGAAYRRTGETVARMIEDANAGVLNVKEVNQRLGKLIRARDFLAKLHGGVVRGGGLSRKFAGLAGAMAGRSTNIPVIGELLGYKIGEYAQMNSVSPARRFAKFIGKTPFGKSERSKVLGRTAADVARAKAERARTPRLGPGKTIFGQPPKPKPDTSRAYTQTEIAERNAQMQREAQQIERRQKAQKTGHSTYLKAESTKIFKGREINGKPQYYAVARGHAPTRISPQEALERKRAGEKIYENSVQAKAELLKERGRVIEGEIVEKKPEPKTYGFNIDAEDARVRSIGREGALPKVKPVSETLAETVQKIKKGEEFGVTLNHNGTVYDGKGAVVTLHSKNFTHEEATPRAISDFLNEMRVAYQDHPNVKFGTFKMDDGHVSVDINMVTRDRGLAKRIATENNQKSYWDYELNGGEGGEVQTGGNGESKFTRSQISDALKLAKESGFGATPKETPQSPKGRAAPTRKSNLNPFTEKTGIKQYDDDAILKADGLEKTSEMMTPDEYLERAAKGFDTTKEKLIEERGNDVPAKYAKAMLAGDKFPVLTITEVGGSFTQEGINRAMAAKIAGVEKVPVVIIKDAKPHSPTPFGKPKFNKPNPETAAVAERYMKAKGMPPMKRGVVDKLDEARAKRIADAFDDMKDEPNNPKVKKAYSALAKETKDQYETLTKAGYKMEPWEGEGQPYKSSGEMVEDIRKNKHLWFFKTDEGFGSGVSNDHPLLKESGIVVNGHKMKYNDLFRAVHDVFGHTIEGNQFGAIGEENAWLKHSQMYSDDARRAMTTETRGQNSWVNFGKSRRNKAGEIIKKGEEGFVEAKDRPYAEQKTGLLPDEFVFQKGETPFGNRQPKLNVSETDGIKHLNPKDYGDFTSFVRDIEQLNDGSHPVEEIELAQKLWGDRPKTPQVEKIEVSKIKLAEAELVNKPKPGRKIEEPIIVQYIDGVPTLVDGRHRLDQAKANGDKTIIAKVSGKSLLPKGEPKKGKFIIGG